MLNKQNNETVHTLLNKKKKKKELHLAFIGFVPADIWDQLWKASVNSGPT